MHPKNPVQMKTKTETTQLIYRLQGILSFHFKQNGQNKLSVHMATNIKKSKTWNKSILEVYDSQDKEICSWLGF